MVCCHAFSAADGRKRLLFGFYGQKNGMKYAKIRKNKKKVIDLIDFLGYNTLA